MAEATAVKERPILMSGEMVRAILSGSKTQTRRVVKPQPPEWCKVAWMFHPDNTALRSWANFSHYAGANPAVPRSCPYGKPGDRLWVRETWYIDDVRADSASIDEQRYWLIEGGDIYYRADGECCEQIPECACAEVGKPRWRPSIHMPRWASRITLEVTDVRVERVQEISEDDAIAEGMEQTGGGRYWLSAARNKHGNLKVRNSARECFRDLWDALNAKRGFPWESNPWVWIVEFKRVGQSDV